MNGRSFEEEANLARARYFGGEYLDRKQFDTMVSQIMAVMSLSPKTILEVGPGNGFVSNFFRSAGFEVTTFDINNNLKPDVVGNLIEIDKYFEQNSFDIILCAEVLEHLPFEYFDKVLEAFNRITSKHLVITLPRRHRILLDLRFYIKVPFIKIIRSNWFFRIPDRQKWEGHHWEIDYSSVFSLNNILKAMSNHFKVLNTYVDESVRHHQYFILLKK